MYLQKSDNILLVWEHAIENGANLVLMRHGPKSGSNKSGLSSEGKEITKKYGEVLKHLGQEWINQAMLGHTEKERTKDTVQLLFPEQYKRINFIMSDLYSPYISDGLQDEINKWHMEVGRWRGYALNQTYCFLGKINDMDRIGAGIKKLLNLNIPIIFCGHSPSLELGVAQVLNIELAELGGFLNPLDSIHLKLDPDSGHPIWIARINPIRDYIDLESEACLNNGSA